MMEYSDNGLHITVCTYRAVFPASKSLCAALGGGKQSVIIVYRSGNGKQALAHSDISVVPDSLLVEVGFN